MKQAGTATMPWHELVRYTSSVFKVDLTVFDQLNKTHEDANTLMKMENYNIHHIRGKSCFH